MGNNGGVRTYIMQPSKRCINCRYWIKTTRWTGGYCKFKYCRKEKRK